MIVSEDDLRFKDPLTVDAELDETTLPCFSCILDTVLAVGEGNAGALFFRLTVLGADDFVEAAEDVVALLAAFDNLGAGGSAGGDLLTGVLLDAIEGLVEVDDRTEVEEAVRFAAGLREFLSTGEDGGRLMAPLVLAAVEGCRGLGVLGVVPVVRTLAVETVEALDSLLVLTLLLLTLRLVAPEVELGVTSDLAVSNAVDASLVADAVEVGRNR